MQANGICDGIAKVLMQKGVASILVMVVEVLVAAVRQVGRAQNMSDVVQERGHNQLGIGCLPPCQLGTLQGVLQLGNAFIGVLFITAGRKRRPNPLYN